MSGREMSGSLRVLVVLALSLALGVVPAIPAQAQAPGTVDVVLDMNAAGGNQGAATVTANKNVNFNVEVYLVAGAQPVMSADVFLNFDNTKLQLMAITPTLTKLDVQTSTTDLVAANANGYADYGAVADPATHPGEVAWPDGTFKICGLTFKGLVETTGTAISFNTAAPRATVVAYNFNSVLGTTTGGTAKIMGPAAKLAFNPQPATPVTAGATWTDFKVEVQDAGGNVITTDSTTSITVTPYEGATAKTWSAGTATQTASAGIATFTNLKYNTASTVTVKATSTPVLTEANSGNVVVQPDVANKLGFNPAPASPVVGAATWTTFKVEVQDQFGNKIATDNTTNITVTPSANAWAAGTSTRQAVAGIATFNDLTYGTAATNVTITVAASSAPVYTPPTAATVVVQGYQAVFNPATLPTPVTAGATWTSFNVEIRKISDNSLVDTFVGNVTVAASAGTLLGTTTKAVASGIATFNDIKINTAATIFITASGTGFVQANSSNVVVNPDTKAKLAFTTQPASTGSVDAALTTQPVVEIQDQFGNKTADTDSVTLSAVLAADDLTAGAGAITVTTGNTNPKAAFAGVVTFAGIGYSKTDTIHLKAASGSLTAAISTTDITLTPGAATKLVFSTQPASTGSVDVAFTTQPAVQVQDQYSNVVTTDNTTVVTLSAVLASNTTTAGAGTLNNPNKTVIAGVATYTNAGYTKVDTILIKATSGLLTQAISTTNITLTPGAANKLAFTTQPAAGAGATVDTPLATQPVVEVRDQYDNKVTTATDSVTLSAVLAADDVTAGAGVITVTTGNTNPKAAAAGVVTFAGIGYSKLDTIHIKAASGTLTAAVSTTDIALPVGAANKLAFSTTSPIVTPVTAGSTWTAFKVEVQDQYSNLKTTSMASILIAPSAGTFVGTTTRAAVAGVATFDDIKYNTPATITVTASSAGLTSATSGNVIIKTRAKNLDTLVEYDTIQAAITAAGAGHTIQVGDGTFTEDIVVTGKTGLTLRSENGLTTIQGVTGVTITVTGGSTNFKLGGAANQGFTVNGHATNTTSLVSITGGESGVVISYNTFTPASGQTAINVGSATTGLTVSYNTITGPTAADANAIVFAGGNAVTSATVSNNTLSKATTKIQLGGAKTLSGISFTSNTFSQTAGAILVEEPADSANTLNNLSISKNTFGASTVANSYAFVIASSVEAADLDYNTIVLKYNDFTVGSSLATGVVANSAGTPGTLKAQYNWWGSLAGPKTTATNPSGSAINIPSANVAFSPWLGASQASLVPTQKATYAQSVILNHVAGDAYGGWNTFASPIALHSSADTWAEIVTATGLTNYVAYYWDGTQYQLMNSSSTKVLNPAEGFMIRVTSAASIPVVANTSTTPPPGRALTAGWNLVGYGSMTDGMDVKTAFVSVETIGSTAGYTHIVSPPANTATWDFLHTQGLGVRTVALGRAYWVNMAAARQFGGFADATTPLTWVS